VSVEGPSFLQEINGNGKHVQKINIKHINLAMYIFLLIYSSILFIIGATQHPE
jgi:hypothetical protein